MTTPGWTELAVTPMSTRGEKYTQTYTDQPYHYDHLPNIECALLILLIELWPVKEHLKVSWSVLYQDFDKGSFGPCGLLGRSLCIELASHGYFQIPSDWYLEFRGQGNTSDSLTLDQDEKCWSFHQSMVLILWLICVVCYVINVQGGSTFSNKSLNSGFPMSFNIIQLWFNVFPPALISKCLHLCLTEAKSPACSKLDTKKVLLFSLLEKYIV